MNHNYKIMIVEDEAITAMMMCSELNVRGYNVSKPVASGEEAILRASDEKPDLIIMDVGLGGEIDGISAAEDIILKIHTRFIFVTGYASDTFFERGKKLDPVAFFTKPFLLSELYAVIDKVMNES
jgi:CheY-like chemotaxis protein